MDTKVPNDVQRLLDLEEIRQLKARFGRLADALCVRPDDALTREFGELFSEDATINSAAFGQYEGRANILALFSRAVPSQMAGMWHGFFNPEIEVDGDRARGEWAMLAYTKPHTPKDAAPMLTIGRYREEYVRVNRLWKLSKLYLETVLTSADSLSRAAAATREAMGTQ